MAAKSRRNTKKSNVRKGGERIFRIYQEELRTTSKSGGRNKSTQLDRR
jgi:hypothetical protein